MTKTIEVEMRGLVPEEELECVEPFLGNNAQFKKEEVKELAKRFPIKDSYIN